MTEIFHEIKRVLKKEGTCWLNLGDSYGSGSRKTLPPQSIVGHYRNEPGQKNDRGKQGYAKQLIGIPWRVAFSLQSDGWILRQDIIWSKPNPMPESVADRCTKSHEYIFLLTKSQRYYFDNEVIKEKTVTKDNSNRDRDNSKLKNTPGRTKMGGLKTNNYEKRNRRSVWTITTKPFKEAHFATFPEALIEPMILAGCQKGGTVLDPFMGAGTTAVVSRKLGRNYLGIELNKDYIKIAEKRLSQKILL